MTRNLRSYAGALLPASATCIVFFVIKWFFTSFLQWFTYAAIEKQIFAFFIFFSISWIIYRLATECIQLMALKLHAAIYAIRILIAILSVCVSVLLITQIFKGNNQSAMYVKVMCQLLVIQIPVVFIYDMVKKQSHKFV